MKAKASSRPTLVWVLIVLLVLLSIGALVAGVLLMVASDGRLMTMPLSILEHSPFKNFLIPGILLFLFNGVYPMGVAYGLYKKPGWRWPDAINPFKDTHWAWAGTMAAGVILIIWITVQVIIMRTAAWIHYLYWAWGLALVLIPLAPGVRAAFKKQSGKKSHKKRAVAVKPAMQGRRH